MSAMGELTFFLGLQVKQKDDGIFISQDKYVADILNKFDFATVKTTSTPMETNKALLKDEEAADVDVHLYRSMIGSLMYLTASRPNIIFAVCACARDSPFDLEPFSDSDYAGASLDKKSTTGGCQFLGRRLISWQCKKKTIVATNSTTEEEYVVISLQIAADKLRILSTWTCNFKQKCVKSQTPRQAKRGLDTKIPQSGGPPEKVGDEAVHKELGDRMERAATTASSLEAEQDNVKTAQIQALVDGNKVIVTETRIRRALHLKDAEGTDCLPNTTIFAELERMGQENKFSGRITPLFPTMLVQAQEEVGEGSANPVDPYHTPTNSQPSTSQPQQKQKSRKSKKKNTELPHLSDSTDYVADENVTPHSNDLLLSGEDSLKLNELMDLCTKLSDRVLALESIKITQALDIASLKRRVKKLKKKAIKRTHKLKRLEYEVMDKDNVDTLVDCTQGDDNLMFDFLPPMCLDSERSSFTAGKEVSNECDFLVLSCRNLISEFLFLDLLEGKQS
ncbi:putative ribonuclease H-like domain-containing protein [Tanacetum coccineum]